MTREDIICMAREIATQYSKAERFQTWTHDFMMQRLMELVAAENEACAKVCEGWEFVPGGHEFTPQQLTKNLTDTLATQIRARRNT